MEFCPEYPAFLQPVTRQLQVSWLAIHPWVADSAVSMPPRVQSYVTMPICQNDITETKPTVVTLIQVAAYPIDVADLKAKLLVKMQSVRLEAHGFVQ